MCWKRFFWRDMTAEAFLTRTGQRCCGIVGQMTERRWRRNEERRLPWASQLIIIIIRIEPVGRGFQNHTHINKNRHNAAAWQSDETKSPWSYYRFTLSAPGCNRPALHKQSRGIWSPSLTSSVSIIICQFVILFSTISARFDLCWVGIPPTRCRWITALRNTL